MMVADVLKWEEMAGDGLLHKKLNSLLTFRFIGQYDFPADECEEEAQELICIWLAEVDWEKKGLEYLLDRFVRDSPEGTVPLQKLLSVKRILQEADNLFHNGPWPGDIQ